MHKLTAKRIFLSLLTVITITVWMGSLSAAHAQWGNSRRSNDRYEDRNRRQAQQECDIYGNDPRNRNGRYDNDRFGNGRYDNGRYDNDRFGNGRSNSGRNNGRFYSADEERGYRDGLRRGRDDYEDRRAPDLTNSSQFRKGNAAYREGFRQGYQDGYPRNGGNRRW